MAKESLVVGQKVWIETVAMFFRSTGDQRKVSRYEIVEANKSSAYAIPAGRLDEYNEDPKRHAYMRKRIVQRNHKVLGDGMGGHYTLWLSSEDFESNVTYNQEIKEVRKQAQDVLNQLTLSDLKKFIQQFD